MIFVIHICISVLIIYFTSQITEKYSSPVNSNILCYSYWDFDVDQYSAMLLRPKPCRRSTQTFFVCLLIIYFTTQITVQRCASRRSTQTFFVCRSLTPPSSSFPFYFHAITKYLPVCTVSYFLAEGEGEELYQFHFLSVSLYPAFQVTHQTQT